MERVGLFRVRRASQHVVQTKQLQFALYNNLLKSSPVLYLYNEPVGTALFLFYFSCLFYLNIQAGSSATNSVVWSLKMTLKASVLLTLSSSLSPLSLHLYISVASSLFLFFSCLLYRWKKKTSYNQKLHYERVSQ